MGATSTVDTEDVGIRGSRSKGRERSVALPEPIPVHIAYWTAWVDDYGTLRFSQDVYDLDSELSGF